MDKRMESIAVLRVLAAASLWGSIGLFVRTLAEAGLTSAQITAIRLLVTAAAMFLYLLLTDKKKLRIAPRDLGWFAANGICSIFLFNICYTTSIQLSSMAVAAVLLYTSPMFVMLICAVFFKERLTGKKLACLLLAFLGCALVSGLADGKMTLTTAGLLFGLLAGLGYALYSIFSGILIHKYHAFTNIFYTFLLAAVISMITADMGEAAAVYQREPQILLLNIAAGFVTSTLPYILYTGALKQLKPSRASLLASIEPAVAAALGFLVLGERMTLFGYVGVILVLGAVFWSNWSGN